MLSESISFYENMVSEKSAPSIPVDNVQEFPLLSSEQSYSLNDSMDQLLSVTTEEIHDNHIEKVREIFDLDIGESILSFTSEEEKEFDDYFKSLV